MIEELKWDTGFFGRKIGRLKLPISKRALSRGLKDAQKKGFKYLLCRLPARNFKTIALLEGAGFYLTDIGLILEMDVGAPASSPISPGPVAVATEKDLPALKKLSERGMFRPSRFYHDPFFKRFEAERLFKAWVENSVRGLTADAVLWMEDVGFVACKRGPAGVGELPLIGVVRNRRGKGFGGALIRAAVEWFGQNGMKKVRTRTQLINAGALNFYEKIGFRAKGADAVFGRVIK